MDDREFAACEMSFSGDNLTMSAAEIIQQIKELPANERAKVARYVAEAGGSPAVCNFSISDEADGLPVIRANGGTITSRLVHEIESRTP